MTAEVCRVLLWLALSATCSAQTWRTPTAEDITPPVRGDGPVLACTAAELARLTAAYAAGVRQVTARVDTARGRLADEVNFPPRGGQHNQWYQCDACQRALTTLSDTRHRCPGCNKVYTGPPYDDVVFSRRHRQNLQRASDAAWAYALSGERAFAADAHAILRGYADRYEAYPYHSNDRDPTRKRDSGGHLLEQTLSEASLLVAHIAPAIDLVFATLSEAERSYLRDHLVRPLVRNVAKCRRGKSNWQSWHNAALFAGGVLLEDQAMMARSVLDPQQGFLFQMRACVSAEGMWYENSFGYHLYTLDALVHHAATARRVGVDLSGHPTLRKMATLPARYLMADGRLPRLGDDVDSTPAKAGRALEAMYAATGDPSLRAVLPAQASWESVLYGRDVQAGPGAPTNPSELFGSAGHAILRAGGPAAPAALMSFAPFGGFHDHFDRLGFVWHAFGSERGVDPGRAASQAYRLPIHNGWYRATLAHNTVVVDGRSQAGAGGELMAFVTGASVTGQGCEAVAARTTAAYPGIEHRRCLVLTDDYLVVMDRLAGEGEHTFDWVYHDAADAVTSPVAVGEVDGPLGIAGEEFVRWLRAGTTEGAIDVRFGKLAHLVVAGAGPTTVRTGTGPFRSVDARAPFVLLRRRGASASFAAVLSAAPDAVRAIRASPDDAGMVVVIEYADRRDRILWDGAGSVRRER